MSALYSSNFLLSLDTVLTLTLSIGIGRLAIAIVHRTHVPAALSKLHEKIGRSDGETIQAAISEVRALVNT
jgi:hypothetical protein